MKNLLIILCVALGLGLAQTSTTQEFTVQLGDFKSKAQLMYSSDQKNLLPTVLLLHAGFPSDMDGTFMDNGETISKNFLDIAKYLSNQGFAVARYNKRYVTTSTDIDSSRYAQLTRSDFIADARVMLQTLRQNKMVDPNKLFVLGWSEGAAVAVQVALQESSLRGLILQGPPVVVQGTDYGTLPAMPKLSLPILIQQGSSDDITIPEQTKRLETALKNNTDAKVIYYPNLGHGLGNTTNSQFAPIETKPLSDLEQWLKSKN
jgi:dienelactone hydrolase